MKSRSDRRLESTKVGLRIQFCIIFDNFHKVFTTANSKIKYFICGEFKNQQFDECYYSNKVKVFRICGEFKNQQFPNSF